MSVIEAADVVTDLLVSARSPQGGWTGELSTSALSTATAVMALELARRANLRQCDNLITNAVQWLANHQNPDGGWGDTNLSHSNISTSMLVNAVFCATPDGRHYRTVIESSDRYIKEHGGVDAVIGRYGKDRTFSTPILTHCALAGVVDWERVPPLPFELACIPTGFYHAVRMPVVSYALPALIAIGQVIFHHRGHWNPILRSIRRRAVKPSLSVLERIQPANGGFLEATPLTAFVCMSLLGCGLNDLTVTHRCLDFIVSSVRKDGSWPIDTNLTTWVTSLSINALSDVGKSHSSEQVLSEPERQQVRTWILDQQYQEPHPYTHADPGGWAWTDLPGGVPDADDTPGAMLALLNLRPANEDFSDREISALSAAARWLLNLQNRDGGWPTFCRGWGTLPFDRSSSDLTAHVLRALHHWLSRVPAVPASLRERAVRQSARGLDFLQKHQTSDGAWLPLWFGNQWNENDDNPLYGTARVVLALCETGRQELDSTQKGLQWLLDNQNSDGSWSARKGLPGSIEETSLAIEALSGHFPGRHSVRSGTTWLIEQIRGGRIAEPSPIGFYFAKLWYFERLYPIIFATAALRRVCQTSQLQ